MVESTVEGLHRKVLQRLLRNQEKVRNSKYNSKEKRSHERPKTKGVRGEGQKTNIRCERDLHDVGKVTPNRDSPRKYG